MVYLFNSGILWHVTEANENQNFKKLALNFRSVGVTWGKDDMQVNW